MAANSKSHTVSQTAYARANIDSCHLGDGIQHEWIKINLHAKFLEKATVLTYGTLVCDMLGEI